MPVHEYPHKTLTKDLLNVNVFETRELLGREAAYQAAKAIVSLQKNQPTVAIIFASAPSQNEFLDALGADTEIDWSRIIAFHMDEYIGLPSDATQNFGYFLKIRLFDKVAVKEVYYINGNAADVELELERYADLLSKNPPDLAFMGIGENCHIAFNDPHIADFNDPSKIKVVELDLASRQQQVNDQCFDQLSDVPTHALTLTIPTLVNVKQIFCMVPGKTKSQAIFHTLTGELTEAYPSTVLRSHPNATLYVDHDSFELAGEQV